MQPNITSVLENSLKLSPPSRWWFFWLILIISVVSLIGNTLAIRSIITRKQKCLQKVCIVCLALSDIFSIVTFGINNLDTLSRELKIWRLGEFLCHFIPMGQVLGTTASSVALLIIALDRYQNVTVAIITQRWNPNVWRCTVFALLCLVACAVMSYPMYVFFTYNYIQVVHVDGASYYFQEAYLCAAIEKDKLKLYYIIMAVLVFLPIVAIFFWFYLQIAALVWRHRKPFVSRYHHSDSYVGAAKLVTKKTKTVQVQRKIRTFKIIVVLMVAFIVCRLPYWLYFVVKLVKTIQGSTMWYINFSLTALNMLNCALNPFLYAFLNQSIHAVRKCNEVACKIAIYCCCCFTSRDFDEFHKNNPFVINFETKKKKVGKEKSVKKSRIKFVDVAHIPVYTNFYPLNKQLV